MFVVRQKFFMANFEVEEVVNLDVISGSSIWRIKAVQSQDVVPLVSEIKLEKHMM